MNTPLPVTMDDASPVGLGKAIAEYLDDQEFHELCMDYRGASILGAPQAFARLAESIQRAATPPVPAAVAGVPDVWKDSVESILKDICQSVKVDGYTQPQRDFLMAIVHRLDWFGAWLQDRHGIVYSSAVPAAVSGEPAWHPISTAPKDGTWIDLHTSSPVFHGVSRREIMCRWSTKGWQHYKNGDYGYVSGDATHWMPIAAAPTAVKEGT